MPAAGTKRQFLFFFDLNFGLNAQLFLQSLFKDKYTEEHLSSLVLNERQIKAVLLKKEHANITNSIYQNICKTSERRAYCGEHRYI